MTYRAIQLGFKVVEVPIVFRDRRAGDSKMDGAIVAEAVFQLPRLRFGSHPVQRAERPREEPTVEEA
jgi:dolichol-phosphate mannosyltransferase